MPGGLRRAVACFATGGRHFAVCSVIAYARIEERVEHVDDEVPVDGRPREEQKPEGGQREPDAERRPDSEAEHELRREADRGEEDEEEAVVPPLIDSRYA